MLTTTLIYFSPLDNLQIPFQGDDNQDVFWETVYIRSPKFCFSASWDRWVFFMGSAELHLVQHFDIKAEIHALLFSI